LKKEEEKRLFEIKNKNDKTNDELSNYEDLIRKTINEINILQISSLKESDSINKEITTLYDKIRILEILQRDVKNEQERKKFQFEYELNKLTTEFTISEEKLY